jgi:hypothetical protein
VGWGIYQLNFIFGEQSANAVDVLHEEQKATVVGSSLGWDGLRVHWSCSHCYRRSYEVSKFRWWDSSDHRWISPCVLDQQPRMLVEWLMVRFRIQDSFDSMVQISDIPCNSIPPYYLYDKAGNNSINPTDWESTLLCNMCVNSQIYCCQRTEILYHWPKTWIKPAIKPQASIWELLYTQPCHLANGFQIC